MEKDKSRKVFVVHGRNDSARAALFSFLRAIGLEPIEFSQAIKLTKKTSPYIGEILKKAFEHAQAIVVLLTGDDEVRLKKEFQKPEDPPDEKNLSLQARPNVLFEAGMAFGKHPRRTVLVEIGTVKPFSDVSGLHKLKLNNSTKRRQELADRLKIAKCSVDLSGTDWHTEGNFEIVNNNIKGNYVKEDDTTSQEPKIEIDEDQIYILKVISVAEDNNFKSVCFKDIEKILNREKDLRINRTKLIHFLDELESTYYYIDVHHYTLGEKCYCITPDGRNFLVRNKII